MNGQNFPQTYVLGLRENFRGTELVDQLARLEFQVNILYGMDGRKHPELQTSTFIDKQSMLFFMHRELSATEIACAKGHRDIYIDFLKTKASHLLVIEDDITLTDPELFQEFILLVSNQKDEDRPVGYQLLDPGAKKQILQKTRKIGEWLLYENCIPSYSTCAYLLTRQAAEILAGSGTRIHCTADWPETASRILWRRPNICLVKYQGASSIINNSRELSWSSKNFLASKRFIVRGFRILSSLLGIRSITSATRGISFRDTYIWDTRWRFEYKIAALQESFSKMKNRSGN